MGKCTTFGMAGVSGTDRQVKFTWKCGEQHVDHYALRFYYYTSKNGWVLGSEANANSRQATWTVPSNHTIAKVKLCAKVVYKTHSVTTGSGSNKKTKQEPWGTDTWAEKAWAVPANVKASNKELDVKATALKSAESAQVAGDKNSNAAAVEKAKNGETPKMVRLYLAAAANYDTASEQYTRAGKPSSASAAASSARSARSSAASGADQYCKTLLAQAKNYAKSGADYVAYASNARAVYGFADAAKGEKSAAAEYSKAVKACQSVIDFDNASAANKGKAQDMKSAYSGAASSATSRAASDAQSNATAYETAPAAPSLTSASVSGGKATLRFACNAPWAAYVEVQAHVTTGNSAADAKSTWGPGKYVAKKLNTADGAMTYKHSVPAGSKVRFRIRAVLAGKDHPSEWVYTDTLHGAPLPSRKLALKVLSQSSVKATWENDGAAGESIELQWSTWYSKGNAWEQNATSQITTVPLGANVHEHTLAGLPAGTKVYVRVKRVSGGGSAWAKLAGNEKAVTASATTVAAKPAKLADLTGMKVTLVNSNQSARVYFEGKVEDGASVTIQRCSVKGSFANNVVENITSYTYTPTTASRTKHEISVGPLDAGKANYFRVLKQKDGQATWATCAKGAWQYGDKANRIAAVTAPAASKALSVPSGLVAAQYGDDGVKLTFTDTPTGAERYEVQYTADSTAFASNAYGEIGSLDLTEPRAGKSSQVATVTGLEPGTKYWLRVRKKDGEGAGPWSANATCTTKKQASQAMTALKGLKAALLSDGDSVKLTFSGVIEADAACRIEHTSSSIAFANNVAADIDSEAYSPAQASASSHTYSVGNLEQGRRHWFRVAKSMGGKTVYADVASGAWKATAKVCAVDVPAPAAGAIAKPASLTATAPRANAIQLSFTCAARAGDEFEAQLAPYPEAFTANAAGDIKSFALSEPSTSSASQVITATGLDSGKTYWARVRKKAATGAGPWSATVSRATLKDSASDMAALTGLKAERLADGATVRLTWSGVVEQKAACTVQHTSVANAFDDNISGAIETEQYTPAQASDTRHTFSVTGLAPGETHRFRIAKSMNGSTLYATVASGSWRASANVAAVAVPAAAMVSPGVPANLVATTPRDGAIRIAFECAALEGEAFQAHVTPYADAFDDNAAADIAEHELDEPDTASASQVMTISGLEAGRTYWVRLRKRSQGGAGEWSEVVEVSLDAPSTSTEELSAPTPTRTDPSYAAGGEAVLSWIHNSSEKSDQSAYEVRLAATPAEGSPSESVVAGGTANALALDLSTYADGTSVEWCVRTAGVLAGHWSPWSAAQSFAVVAPPTAGMSLADASGALVGGDAALTSLPLSVTVTAGAGALDYPVHVRAAILAAAAYDAEAEDGSGTHVSEGDEVWSADLYPGDEGFDGGAAVFAVQARDAVLVSGASYAARAWVYTAMGMAAEAAPVTFPVDWGVELPQPSCSVVFDYEDLTCRIFPACWVPEPDEEEEEGGQQAEEPAAGDASDDEIDEEAEAIAALDPAEGTYYPDGEDGEPYYTEPAAEDEDYARLQPGVELDVYRIDMDGTAVLVADGLPNNGKASCTDPHPNFGTLTYRVVAKSTSADVQSSAETSVEADVRDLVITYDEGWAPDAEGDFAEYTGRLVRLGLALESNEEPAADSEMLKLAGDAYPTLYEGESGDYRVTYNAEYLLSDAATRRELRGLRGRLAYVRDPLGVGFWARVRAVLGNARPPFASASVTCERVMPPKEA